MKARVTFPKSVEIKDVDKYFKSVSSESLELDIVESSLCEYKIVFKKAGQHGMNVDICEDFGDNKKISCNKNLECLCRKLILCEKIFSKVRNNALIYSSMFRQDEMTDEDKKVSEALSTAFTVLNSYINGDIFKLEPIDLELICKAAAYRQDNNK